MTSTEYGKYKLQNGIKISFHQTEESPQVFTAWSDGDLGHKIWEKVWSTIGLSRPGLLHSLRLMPFENPRLNPKHVKGSQWSNKSVSQLI